MGRLLVPLLLVAFLFSTAGLNTVVASLNESSPEKILEYVPDEVVVKFKPRVSYFQKDIFNRFFGTRFTRTRRFADFTTLRIPSGVDAKTFAERLAADERVEYAEPNYIAHALMVPNDPYYSYQWNFDNPTYGGIHAQDAWDVSSGAGTVVAIVDTGIAYENYRQSWRNNFEIAPDLVGTCFVAGYDFVGDDSHANDDEGHGTHVAGTLAQVTNNNLGVAGLAHSSCLMPVKVLNSRGSGTYADIAEGIRFAADNGVQVINLSLGGSVDAQVLRESVAYAHSKGTVIVAAAGNEGVGSSLYPAAYDNDVIAVGATRFDETLTYYSNYGSSIDLVAPGGDLKVDQNGDGYKDGILQQTFNRNPRDWDYWFYQGTSMASPHVAAVAAMVIANGITGPDSVRAALEGSAEDLGISGRDDTYGWGLVDAAAALGITPSPTPTPTPAPTSEPSSTPTPQPGDFKVAVTKHTASTRWSRRSGGIVDLTLAFKVEEGSSDNVVVKEIVDGVGSWGLYRGKTKVYIYINGSRYKTNFVWNAAAGEATVDIGSLGVTLFSGDTVEVRNLRLVNDTRGGHDSTGQIWEAVDLILENTVEFSL